MTTPVLLDNTVLTNFALLNRPHLVLNLWLNSCTTPAVQAEYQVGTATYQLPLHAWDDLSIVTLTDVETDFAHSLNKRLGSGERTCIAVAHHRNGLFATDDFDARRQAKMFNIPITGTIGILILNITQHRITLAEGNQWLSHLITTGYRSPVVNLNDFF
jgi:predicted nucleic acid-binding protein